jgi:hypothetical protein
LTNTAQFAQRRAPTTEYIRRQEWQKSRVGDATYQLGRQATQRRAKEAPAQSRIQQEYVEACVSQPLGGKTARRSCANHNCVETI